MARFRTVQAFHFGSTRIPAGRTIADTQGNALPGDIVWPVTSQNLPAGFVPLDGLATTMKAASPLAAENVRCTITGVDSIG
jgi:hypothetical protein